MKSPTPTRAARRLAFSLSIALLAPLAAAEAGADCSPISSLPFTATAAGTYCLEGDLFLAPGSTSDGITIASSYVTIDLQGHAIGGGGQNISSAGIRGTGVSHVTIRNGSIRTFNTGIRLDGNPGTAYNNLIEDVRIQTAWYTGMHVSGDNLVVRRCQVLKVGGTLVNGSSPTLVGIYTTGRNISLSDNEIAEFPILSPNELGIWIQAVNGAILERNRIYGPTYSGIVSSSQGTNLLVSDNRVVMPSAGIGLLLSGSNALYRDNLVIGATTKYAGGTDAGNNQ